MKRFEIEDIVTQDKHGIVYRAHDSSLDRTVALRRFFPFGQNGGGLEKEETQAFEIAALRLAEVKHESLRSVIHGGVDPIDDIPYLVTEWVDGLSLRQLLAEESLDPALVIDIMRLALEVSIVLSHVLGEEAVWVETEIEAIVVGSDESGRGFTFWISPFKWLGNHSDARKLSSLVSLGEELAGWKKKIVNDQAGHGLGGWFKWLKKNPDTSLREAMEVLAASTGNEPPAPEEQIVERAIASPRMKLKQRTSKFPMTFAMIVILMFACGILFYLHRTAQAPTVASDFTEQEISPLIVEKETRSPSVSVETAPPTVSPIPAPEEPKNEPEPPATLKESVPMNATDRFNAMVERIGKETAERDEKAEQAAEGIKERGDVYLPEDHPIFDGLKNGQPVKLRGTLRSTTFSGSKETLYLHFSKEASDNTIKGAISKRDFTGKYGQKIFATMIGKEITLDGEKYKEPSDRRLVKIVSLEQIKTAE